MCCWARTGRTGCRIRSADPTTIAHRHGTHRITSPTRPGWALQPFSRQQALPGRRRWLDCWHSNGSGGASAFHVVGRQGKSRQLSGCPGLAVMESWRITPRTSLPTCVVRDRPGSGSDRLTTRPTSPPAGSFLPRRRQAHLMNATTLPTGRRTWVPWTAVLVNVATRDCWEPPIKRDTGLASGNCYDERHLARLVRGDGAA